MDIANLEKPDLAPEFYEISNLSKRTSSKKKNEEADGISFLKTEPMGTTEKNYELNFEKTRLSANKFKNMDLANLEKPDLVPEF